MKHSESNQDQLSLISISIYLPLLILFILLAISANTTLKHQYNNNQLYKNDNPEKLYILREQQIHTAKSLLRDFFAPYTSFHEIKNPIKTNNFLVFKTDYYNIYNLQSSFITEAENQFFTTLLQSISQLGNIQLEIIFPSQISFSALTNLKESLNKILVRYNLPSNIYVLGLSDEENNEVYLNFKLSH